MTASLLAHIAARFAPRQWENIATESLRFLLNGEASESIQRVLAPVVSLPTALIWTSQVGSPDDQGIPDLVGEDSYRRPLVIIEGKFWASLTDNQPLTYLARQRGALEKTDPGARSGVLVFLVPTRRQSLIAAELEIRMGCLSAPIAGTDLIELDNGQRVIVATWGRLLDEMRQSLERAGAHAALADLGQLAGLCDRADAEAMLPFTASEIGSEVARRVYDLHEIVDLVTDELIRRKQVDVRGLRAVGGKGRYGRYMRVVSSGHIVELAVLLWSWAELYPSPIWLRLWKPTPEATEAWTRLEHGQKRAFPPDQDYWLRLALPVPLAVEADVLVSRLADTAQVALSVLPSEGRSAAMEAVGDAAEAADPYGAIEDQERLL